MTAFEEALKMIRDLPEEDRERLVEELQGDGSPQRDGIPDDQRLAAMDRWLSHAGIGHSDFADVSSNKRKHLAEVYATKP